VCVCVVMSSGLLVTKMLGVGVDGGIVVSRHGHSLVADRVIVNAVQLMR
jgi:hypothetical protein